MKAWNGRSGYSGRKHVLRNVILALLVLAVLCFAALEGVIWQEGRSRTAALGGESEVMVIFGCQVKPDGPSILLRDRLDTALTYLEEHPDITVVVTGGKGDDEHISEAQCMYDYLTAHGVDGENILMEYQSRNTYQNIYYTLCLLTEAVSAGELDEPESYVLVSSDFHLARIQLLWGRAQGGETANISTLAAPVSDAPSKIQMFFREPLALVKSFVFDRNFYFEP